MGDSTFLKVPGWLQEILTDPFRRYLFLGLIVLGSALFFHEQQGRQQTAGQDKQISFFFHPQCPHCRKQKEFNL